MTAQARKVALERKHAELESALHHLSQNPSADSLETAALKREKLRVKDELLKMAR